MSLSPEAPGPGGRRRSHRPAALDGAFWGYPECGGGLAGGGCRRIWPRRCARFELRMITFTALVLVGGEPPKLNQAQLASA